MGSASRWRALGGQRQRLAKGQGNGRGERGG